MEEKNLSYHGSSSYNSYIGIFSFPTTFVYTMGGCTALALFGKSTVYVQCYVLLQAFVC